MGWVSVAWSKGCPGEPLPGARDGDSGRVAYQGCAGDVLGFVGRDQAALEAVERGRLEGAGVILRVKGRVAGVGDLAEELRHLRQLGQRAGLAIVVAGRETLAEGAGGID